MIQDGNAQILRSFEARKKSGDYARSQTSRNKKHPELNMNQVDWSGFPGAAHKASPAERNQKRATRRGSLQHDGTGDLEEHKNNLHRAQRRLSASGHGPSFSPPETLPEPPAPSLSPKLSPSGKKYRNRRHLSFSGPVPNTAEAGESEEADRVKRKLSLIGAKARAERRNSGNGSHRMTRRPSSRSVDRSKSRSKSRTRRPQSAAQQRPLSPGPAIRSRTRSTSPSGRMRRPVAAAASSTTLEVGKNTGRRKTRQQSHSRDKRKGNQLKPSSEADEGLFRKASSFRW